AIIELVVAGKAPRYALALYSELAAEGEPVIAIEDRAAIDKLARLLGRELNLADDLLARERRRALGRKAWLDRAGKAVLPTHVNYIARGPVSVMLESGPVRGEVGVDDHLFRSP